MVSSSGGTALDLSWGQVPAVNGYRLERKTGTAGTWGALTSLGNVTSYTDNAPNINTEYCYRLIAFDSNVDVQQSLDDGVCGTTGGTPANFAASPANTTQINLAWSDRTSTETQFSIDRCLGLSCDFSARDTFSVGSNLQAYSDISACKEKFNFRETGVINVQPNNNSSVHVFFSFTS